MTTPIPPRISIGVPVYNGEDYLEEALQSILAQTYSHFELIISDNASTDRTREICERYAAQDARIRYHRIEANMGAAWNFNHVFALSTAEYFKWAAHDDLMAPNFLEKCITVLDQHPEVILCSTLVMHIDDHGVPVEFYPVALNTTDPSPRRRFRELILEYHLCYEVFGVIRRESLAKTGLIGNFAHGDGILLEELGLQGRFYEIPEVLFYARKHARQSMNLYGVFNNGENDYHTYTLWFDPKKAGRIIFPYWRILAAHFRAVFQARISMADRMWCSFYILYWAGRRRRPLVFDLWLGACKLGARLGFSSKQQTIAQVSKQ